eukprot:1792697-Prymnesium_polylepis.1
MNGVAERAIRSIFTMVRSKQHGGQPNQAWNVAPSGAEPSPLNRGRVSPNPASRPALGWWSISAAARARRAPTRS